MLYVVATPIGNLGDITLRALEVLKNVDLIAAEDTRHSGMLLKHFEIKKPLLSYHEHNEAMRTAQLVERLATGENVALITDAGMPGLSDPGARRERELRIAAERAETTMFLESPYRLIKTLGACRVIIPDRQLCVARELTKKFEEFRRGTASELLAHYEAHQPKGEIVLLISGR